MTDPSEPHPSHVWAQPDKEQTSCRVCGAYRHLSSGLSECKPQAVALDPAKPLSPMAMIAAAIQQKMDPGALKELTDLAERWRKMDAEQQFNESMVACQAEMPSVVKDAVAQNKRYAKYETVIRAAKPIYTKHGFAVNFVDAIMLNEGTMRITGDVVHRGGHVKRHTLDLGLDGIGPNGNPIGGMNRPQASGSTTSYGQRYLIKIAFNIPIADEDDDAAQARTMPVTPDQIGQINDLIRECEAAGNAVNFPGFLKWLSVENLEELRQSDLPKALKELQRKKLGGKR